MKTITERNTEIITDLIKINNDRVAGYTKAAKEISETDDELKLLFEDMAAQSTQFASELRKWIDSTDYEPLNSTTISGGIYRVWMDVKATFTGDDRKAVLASCEYGEDAALRAYEQALGADKDLSEEQFNMIENQRNSLRESHDYIKKIRDHE
jgi:uncharacterized protein (TIGR02284 family)